MSMLGAFMGAMGKLGIPAMSLSGSLSATGSTTSITGTSRTVTVPAGNPGNAYLDNLGGDGVLNLNVNGAGFTSGPWTISDGQSIQARGSGLSGVGVAATGDLIDGATFQIIASINITRTS